MAGFAGTALAGTGDLSLLPAAQVDSAGIFLDQVISGVRPDRPRPIRLTEAPRFGQAKVLSRGEVLELWRTAEPDGTISNSWSGAASVRVLRRSRLLGESDLKQMLTAVLQSQVVRERGEVDLRLGRPWAPVHVPDENLVLRLLDVPAGGVSAHFIARFELVAGNEPVGPWQVILQARVLKNVLVAKSTARRGQTLSEADLDVERRDVLPLREPVEDSLRASSDLELVENIMAGYPVLARSIRQRPVVQRGQLVDGRVFDGSLRISLKVEVLADGVPGQMVRVRNPKTRKEFHAKVQDEQTVVINL
jgi:flagella basal body P-ring formation protein FlgA